MVFTPQLRTLPWLPFSLRVNIKILLHWPRRSTGPPVNLCPPLLHSHGTSLLSPLTLPMRESKLAIISAWKFFPQISTRAHLSLEFTYIAPFQWGQNWPPCLKLQSAIPIFLPSAPFTPTSFILLSWSPSNILLSFLVDYIIIYCFISSFKRAGTFVLLSDITQMPWTVCGTQRTYVTICGINE